MSTVAEFDNVEHRPLSPPNVASLNTTKPVSKSVEVVPVSIWEISTGKRLAQVDALGANIIWSDLEIYSNGKIESLITGEIDGTVRIWNWNSFGYFDEKTGMAVRKSFTNKNASAEILEFNVSKSKDVQNADLTVVGYSLSRHEMTLAVAFSNSTEETSSGSLIELWSITTGQKLKNYHLQIPALPCIIGPQSHPTLSISWGLPSVILNKCLNDITVATSKTNHAESGDSSYSPISIVAGPCRLIVSKDIPITYSTAVADLLDRKVGKDMFYKCTASLQSPSNAKVMMVAFGDILYWICEEPFSIHDNFIPHEKDITNTTAPVTKVFSSEEQINSRQAVGNNSLSNSVQKDDTSALFLKSGRRRSSLKQQQQPNSNAEGPAQKIAFKVVGVEDDDPNNTKMEPTVRNSDFCLYRIIKTPPAESVISIHHLTNQKGINAVAAATDSGTVIVYDLNIPSSFQRGTLVQEIKLESPVLAIWHAGTPLLGMVVQQMDDENHGPMSDDN